MRDAPGGAGAHEGDEGEAGSAPFVVLGVSAGIAAYKAVDICRRLVDAGVHVAPVLTERATHFVGRTTFDALGSEPAQLSLWDELSPIPHTRLGQRADVVVVAPATADLIGRYAAGLADDLLTTTLVATAAPVVLCPAMHTEMWEHPAVRHNLEVLARRGVRVVEPERGRLAGGDEGPGRLAEPAAVVEVVLDLLRGAADRSAPGTAGSEDGTTGADVSEDGTAGADVSEDGTAGADVSEDGTTGADVLAGRRVVVSAGGTREPIDPVRFITNRSSGKQGHAVAAAALARGAEVTLVTASRLPTDPAIEVVPVETAADMEAAMLARSAEADVVVMAAAVADFRPKAVAERKLHKTDGLPELVLEPTPDILAELGRRRHPGQILVGFAAETDGVRDRATAKLVAKGVDLMVANDVSAPEVGFDHDTNAVTLLDATGGVTEVPLTSKQAVAHAILDRVGALLGQGQQPD